VCALKYLLIVFVCLFVWLIDRCGYNSLMSVQISQSIFVVNVGKHKNKKKIKHNNNKKKNKSNQINHTYFFCFFHSLPTRHGMNKIKSFRFPLHHLFQLNEFMLNASLIVWPSIRWLLATNTVIAAASMEANSRSPVFLVVAGFWKNLIPVGSSSCWEAR
jgi:hypothetical protein